MAKQTVQLLCLLAISVFSEGNEQFNKTDQKIKLYCEIDNFKNTANLTSKHYVRSQ